MFYLVFLPSSYHFIYFFVELFIDTDRVSLYLLPYVLQHGWLLNLDHDISSLSSSSSFFFYSLWFMYHVSIFLIVVYVYCRAFFPRLSVEPWRFFFCFFFLVLEDCFLWEKLHLIIRFVFDSAIDCRKLVRKLFFFFSI